MPTLSRPPVFSYQGHPFLELGRSWNTSFPWTCSWQWMKAATVDLTCDSAESQDEENNDTHYDTTEIVQLEPW